MLKIGGIKSVDNTSDKNVMAIKLSTYSNKNSVLSILKKESNILHAWEALTLDSLPFLPTGEVLLKPKIGLTLADILNTLNLKNQVTISAEKYYDIYVLNVIDSNSLFNVANSIYESKMVDWCHPNFYVPITNYTNDPLWAQQYYLRNTGQFGGIAGIDINVEGAWNITRGNANIRIAVIDEGVEDHEDLAGRVLNGFTPRNVNGNGRPIITGAHGEATAGIIAATQDNFIGITGIAPLCQIVPINIFAGGETALDVANGINWAWNQGQAAVLSNSWGYNTSSQTQPNFDAIIQAITNARTQGRNGLGSVVVFSAGNGGNIDVSFPGNVNGVITVGSCNNLPPSGQLWNYSQRGPSMDLVAPSGDINLLGDVVTLDRMGNLGYEVGNYTSRFGGTSAACPQVSGIAALMLSANANLTETQIRTTLQNTAVDMGTAGFDNSFGFGRVNACAAVRAVLSLIISGDNNVCATSNLYTIPNLPTGSTVSWTATLAGIANINTPNTTQTTLTKTSNGLITLTASVSNVCGLAPISVTKQVAIGTPVPFIQSTTYAGLEFVATANYIPGATYNWYFNNVLDPSTHTRVYNGGVDQCGVSNKLAVQSVTICGTSAKSLNISIFINCGGGGQQPQFSVSPNPGSSSITLQTLDNSTFEEVRIYDKLGGLHEDMAFPKNTQKTTLDISQLPTDIYQIQIFDVNNGKLFLLVSSNIKKSSLKVYREWQNAIPYFCDYTLFQ